MVRERTGWADLALWVRVEWRSSWRSYAALAGVIALMVGVLVATFTAVSRTETAFARLRSATQASDITLLYGGPLLDDPVAVLSAALQMEGVIDAVIERFPLVLPAGTDRRLIGQLRTQIATTGPVNSPVIVSGRSVDETNANEAVISEVLARQLRVSVGDSIPLDSATRAWLDSNSSSDDAGPPDGPKVTVTVVGLSRSPGDFDRSGGSLYLSPAFMPTYGESIAMWGVVEARLTDEAMLVAGTAQGPALPEPAYGAMPSQFGVNAATTTALRTLGNALRLVGIAAGIAGAVAVTVILLRLVTGASRHRAAFVAMGWTRQRHLQAIVIALAPWLAIGLVAGAVVGTWLSPLAVVSLARQIDPAADSVLVNTPVVLIVVAAVVLLGALVGVVVVRRAVSGRVRHDASSRQTLGIHRPIAVSLGIRQALFARSDRGGRASRGALAAVTLGVVGAVAAMVVSASIDRLHDNPRLSGQVINRSVSGAGGAAARLSRDDRVSSLATLYYTGSLQASEGGHITGLVYDIERGELPLIVLRGRLASQPDEVVFGPQTLASINKHIGDVITLNAGVEVDGEPVYSYGEYHIVGEVIFQEGELHHDDGLAVTLSGADRLVGDITSGGVEDDGSPSYAREVAFEWAEGVDTVAADAELESAGFKIRANDLLTPPVVTNLARVSELPRLLAAFLGGLALISLSHALTVSVRSRSREIVTLRALGLASRTGVGIFGIQTFVLVALALLAGIPMGFAVGRQVWRPIANRAHVVVSVAMPWGWIGVVGAMALVGVMTVSLWVGWRVRRLRSVDILRTG